MYTIRETIWTWSEVEALGCSRLGTLYMFELLLTFSAHSPLLSLSCPLPALIILADMSWQAIKKNNGSGPYMRTYSGSGWFPPVCMSGGEVGLVNSTVDDRASKWLCCCSVVHRCTAWLVSLICVSESSSLSSLGLCCASTVAVKVSFLFVSFVLSSHHEAPLHPPTFTV